MVGQRKRADYILRLPPDGPTASGAPSQLDVWSCPRITVTRLQPPAIALLTHTFPPDPAAVGQHMADLATELARRGNRIIVITSDRGYDNPTARFPKHEVTADGVEVRRLALTSFGKATLFHRVLAIAFFMVQAAPAAARIKNLGGIVFSTSPPFIGTVAALIGSMCRVPIVFWAMDLNPDQLVALGKLSDRSLAVRTLRALNRFTLRRTQSVIALDDIMAARLIRQGASPARIVVSPPWSPQEALETVPRARNDFRTDHDLVDFTVIMYSGNHTLSNPLTTLLHAAVAMRDEARLKFVFVGDGLAKREVETIVKDNALTNVVSLPYQPRSRIAASLSAGDVHVVSLGAEMAGVIHPCKVYGAMAVARPILYFGPSPSHVSALIAECGNGWTVAHGDVASAVATLRAIADTPREALDSMGNKGRDVLYRRFRPEVLTGRVADAVEIAMMLPRTTGV